MFMNYYVLIGGFILLIQIVGIGFEEIEYKKVNTHEARVAFEKTVKEFLRLTFGFILLLIAHSLKVILS